MHPEEPYTTKEWIQYIRDAHPDLGKLPEQCDMQILHALNQYEERHWKAAADSLALRYAGAMCHPPMARLLNHLEWQKDQANKPVSADDPEWVHVYETYWNKRFWDASDVEAFGSEIDGLCGGVQVPEILAAIRDLAKRRKPNESPNALEVAMTVKKMRKATEEKEEDEQEVAKRADVNKGRFETQDPDPPSFDEWKKASIIVRSYWTRYWPDECNVYHKQRDVASIPKGESPPEPGSIGAQLYSSTKARPKPLTETELAQRKEAYLRAFRAENKKEKT